MVAVFTGRGRPNIQVSVGDAISSNGVGIAVDVVALIRFGSTDEAIETGIQRFLTADRQELKGQLTEIIAGNMRRSARR